MLWFLHVACDAGFLVESYEDEAEGRMSQNEHGALWVSQIMLRPKIAWGSDKRPIEDEVAHLHRLAHKQCFIANSIKTEVRVE